MSQTAVVCTSTSGLVEQPELPDLRILPLHVLLESRDLLDGKQISTKQFYQWMHQHPDQVASTTPPHPSEIRDLFDSLIRNGYTRALVLTLSSSLSQTYSLIRNVAQEYRGRLEVTVFDT